MSAFTRLSFVCIPGALLPLYLWALVFGVVLPVWLINGAALAGMLAAALAAIYQQQRANHDNRNN